MIIRSMDKKRAKGRILRSLTWKHDSIKEACKGSREGRAGSGSRARKNDIIRTRCHQAITGDKDRKEPIKLGS